MLLTSRPDELQNHRFAIVELFFAYCWYNLPVGNVNKLQAIEFATAAIVSVPCIFKIEK